jgi:ABC-type lipopolysaccharide export system ATPase subunit
MGTLAFDLRGGEKRYRPGEPPVFRSIDLTVDHGEILVVLGPSGCLQRRPRRDPPDGAIVIHRAA